MFPSQKVRLKIVSPILSKMVRLKIVSHSNLPLYSCFPRKWYVSKLFPTQIGDLIHVSLANGTSWNYFPLANWPLYTCFPCKWYASNCFPLKSATLSMFPSQMVRLKIVSHSNRPLYRCFPRKWYALKIVSHSNQPFYRCFPRKWYASKLFPTQISHFIHVSLANGTPQNYFPFKGGYVFATWLSMFPSQMVRLKNIIPLNSATFIHVSLTNRYAWKLCSHSNRPFWSMGSLANGKCLENCVHHSNCATLYIFPSQMVMRQNCFPLKLATLSMFHSQMVRLKIISHSNWPLYRCFCLANGTLSKFLVSHSNRPL